LRFTSPFAGQRTEGTLNRAALLDSAALSACLTTHCRDTLGIVIDDEPGGDPGPIWEHLPVGDPNIPPRQDVFVGKPSQLPAGPIHGSPVRVIPFRSLLTSQLKSFTVVTLILCLSAVPNLLLHEWLQPLRANGSWLGSLPMFFMQDLIRTYMYGIALGMSALVVFRKWPDAIQLVRLLTGSVLGAVVIALGLLVFVPGLVLLIRWALAPIVLVNELVSSRQALKRSAQLMQGHGFLMFRTLLFIGVVSIMFYLLMGHVFGTRHGNWEIVSMRTFVSILYESFVYSFAVLWLIRVYEETAIQPTASTLTNSS
jgi:hypothetical protein